MDREIIEAALASAVDELSASGIRWQPGSDVAPIAYRRWASFSRRKRGRPDTNEQRIKDLAKGLQAHFEPDVPYTHPTEWHSLAIVMAGVLQKFGQEKGISPISNGTHPLFSPLFSS